MLEVCVYGPMIDGLILAVVVALVLLSSIYFWVPMLMRYIHKVQDDVERADDQVYHDTKSRYKKETRYDVAGMSEEEIRDFIREQNERGHKQGRL